MYVDCFEERKRVLLRLVEGRNESGLEREKWEVYSMEENESFTGVILDTMYLHYARARRAGYQVQRVACRGTLRHLARSGETTI